MSEKETFKAITGKLIDALSLAINGDVVPLEMTKNAESIDDKPVRKLLLKCEFCPGDLIMLTVGIKALHENYKGKFITGVKTSCDEIFMNNPYVTPMSENDPGVEVLKCDYPLINDCNKRPYHFVHGYPQFFENTLGLKFKLLDQMHGDIYLSEEEKKTSILEKFGIDKNYWLIFAGGKFDYTAKWWNPESYQKVVDHFKDKILFVQCGESHHDFPPPLDKNFHFHPPLKNVINLVGKTKPRELMQLMYFASGVICPVTYAMHLAAAVPTPNGMIPDRPCVVIAGGREGTHWESYPNHRFLSLQGALPCCATGGCWKSRCTKMNDGKDMDKPDSLCFSPVDIGNGIRIPKCMNMIKPEDVIRSVEWYYEGGVLSYNRPPVFLEKKDDGFDLPFHPVKKEAYDAGDSKKEDIKCNENDDKRNNPIDIGDGIKLFDS